MHSECEGDSRSCLSFCRSGEVHLTTERPSFCNMETERQKSDLKKEYEIFSNITFI